VLASGKSYPIRKFVELAAAALDIGLRWEGEGTGEQAIDTKTGKTVVSVSPQFYRPAEVDLLLGDPTKAKKELGWEAKISVEQMTREMVEADLRRVQQGRALL
jgi:GDPmannose 4,6-dehydratase